MTHLTDPAPLPGREEHKVLSVSPLRRCVLLGALSAHLGGQGVCKGEEIGAVPTLLSQCQLALKKLHSASRKLSCNAGQNTCCLACEAL